MIPMAWIVTVELGRPWWTKSCLKEKVQRRNSPIMAVFSLPENTTLILALAYIVF